MTAPEDLGKALTNRYRLDRQLGHGGMAIVYLVETSSITLGSRSSSSGPSSPRSRAHHPEVAP